MNWEAVVPLAYPSANVYMRSHWTQQREIKQTWKDTLSLLLATVPHAAKRRRVNIIRYGSRQLDYGNLWLGADKIIFDSLVALELLVDDSPTWIEPSIEQIKCKRKDEKTVIQIYESDEREETKHGDRSRRA